MKFYQFLFFTGLDHLTMKVCSVDNRIWISEPFSEFITKRNLRYLLISHGIHEAKPFNIHGLFPRALSNAEIV